MSSVKNNYTILIEKIDEFTRKYYKNQLIRGALYFTGAFVLFFLLVTTLEYFGQFGTTGRTILFWLFVATSLGIVTKWVVIPLTKLYKLGKVISHREAAIIIGRHFGNVKDKLLNVLELKELNDGNNPLVMAGIEQKTAELSPIPFTNAIDLKANRKYLKYALPPVLVLLIVVMFYPGLIAESSNRLVNFNTYFAPKAPFQFNVLNKDLKVVQNQDFQLNLKMTGEVIPEEVFVEIGDVRYKMEREKTISFTYIFRNVQKDVEFRLVADGYESPDYTLRALPNPIILNFDVKLDYPAYTGKQPETIKNTGDFIAPEGTQVTWTFNTQNTQNLKMAFNDTAKQVSAVSEGKYSFSTRLMSSKMYSITTSNQYLSNRDSVRYSISVVPDQYPTIEVDEYKDSLTPKRLYFNGVAKDDYGFRRMTFNYAKIDQNGKPLGGTKVFEVPFNAKSTASEYFYMWDLNLLTVAPGDMFEYYFEVWDNDGVHGAKSARTVKKIYNVPTLAEKAENTAKANKVIKDDLSESISKAKNLQKEIDQFNKKMMGKKQMTFEDKKNLQNILNEQKELKKKVEEINQQNKEKNNNEEPLSPEDQRILEKQQELEKLLNEIMTPELQKLMDELQKMMDKLDKEQVQKMLEEMKLTNEDLEKELDRSLEMFKRLEFEDKLQSTIDRLDELQKQQDSLANDTKEGKESPQELNKKQDEINKEFEKLEKELKDLENLNKELETPNEFDNPEGEQKEIEKDLNESKENLNNNKQSKASQSQSKASQKMKNMKEGLQKQMDAMQKEENEEDLKSMRQLLENLVKLSFDQEELINRTAKTNINNPLYNKLMQDQKKLKDDGMMIEDSLLALSKRVPEISTMINREIGLINNNMGKAIAALEDRTTATATGRMQYVMTSVNNLALLLSDIADQMQMQMPSGMAGSGSCKKPGASGKKPTAGDIRKMQEQLQKDIKDAKEGLQKGKKPGQGAGAGGGMSQTLAKLAAQQEALRKFVQGLASEMGKEGKEGLDKIIQDMEKTEEDIVNKNITEETLKRQADIMTRLLEAEKSERERDEDNKREAEEGKDTPNGNPALFFEYNRKKLKETELLKTVPPAMNLFYRQKVNDYFNSFENKTPAAPSQAPQPKGTAVLPGDDGRKKR